MNEHKEVEDTNLIIFNLFSKLIHELHNSFNEKQPSLNLYNRLIEKTCVVHKKAIEKHIQEIKDFCVKNEESIYNKNSDTLQKNDITYSENVSINMKEIFDIADEEEKTVIWKYLLLLSAYVHPSGKAKDYLNQQKKKSPNCNNENDFLKNMIEKVEGNVDSNDNPMESVSKILSSGVFTDLVTDMNDGIKSGQLDLGKLMGSVQNIATSAGINPNASPPPGGNIDLNAMMSQMTGMMSQLAPKKDD